MTTSRGGADTRAAVVLVLVVAVADAVPPGELRLVAGPALMSCAPAHAEAEARRRAHRPAGGRPLETYGNSSLATGWRIAAHDLVDDDTDR